MDALKDKGVIVTGAGKGLGQGYARALGRYGAGVIVNDVNPDSAAETARLIREDGGRAEAFACNIADEREAQGLIDACLKAYGKIDVLLNNAGIYWNKPIWEETPESYRRVFDVNVFGTVNTILAALPHMREQRSGSIINIVSGAAIGYLNMSPYSASKGAVASLTYSAAYELASHGIRVNAIDPRGLDKPQADTVVHPVGHAPTVAPLAVFLASDASKNVTGQIIRLEFDGRMLYLEKHPKLGRSAYNPERWTYESITQNFDAMLGRELEPVGLYARKYEYYGGLEGPAPGPELWAEQREQLHGGIRKP